MMWRKRPFSFLMMLSLLPLLAGCGLGERAKTIQTEGMRFVQDEVRVKAGQPVTLRVVNRDGYAHAFDLDEFGIHTPLAANEAVEITFMAEENGRYTFYCSSPGHQAAGMSGTLIVEP